MRIRILGRLLLFGLLALLGLAACSGDSNTVALDELVELPDDQPALLFFYTDN